MAKLTEQDQREEQRVSTLFCFPGILAPSAILTPKRLRERELARAGEAPRDSDSPTTRELRLFLQPRGIN